MIEFKDVRKEYNDSTVLNEISFTVPDGEFCFIQGKSGAGKTTVTKLLTLEERVDSGSITVNGEDITKFADFQIPYFRRTIGMVFQDFRLFDDKTAYENVAFAMRVVGVPGKEIRERVPKLLQTVAMLDKAKHFPSELSGGEKQRIALARAIANNPEIILADEPTGSVDPEMGKIIMNILYRINTVLRKTVIVVTHDDATVARMGCRVITLDNGVVVSDTPAIHTEAAQ